MSLLTTLGMFIIDDNQYHSLMNKAPEFDIIGGGASYTIIGARMVAGATLGKQIKGFIDKGNDFPEAVEKELRSWGTGMIFREDPTRLTTRGVNAYDEFDIRNFKLVTPRKRIEYEDISASHLLESKSFHFCCAIERCGSIIDKINLATTSLPVYIFEPSPADCLLESWPGLPEVLAKVDIFTPNFDEACALLSISQAEKATTKVEDVAATFAKYLRLPNSGILIRCGANGCYVHTIDNYKFSVPAYHIDQAKVIDVTGGGNSFCGGFVTGFLLTKGDWIIGAIMGSLVSGCIIERLGMPIKEVGCEKWNGQTMTQRLAEFLSRNPHLVVDTTKIDWFPPNPSFNVVT
jgi:sugar/nucleoside kinase (ribokinase family)